MGVGTGQRDHGEKTEKATASRVRREHGKCRAPRWFIPGVAVQGSLCGAALHGGGPTKGLGSGRQVKRRVTGRAGFQCRAV